MKVNPVYYCDHCKQVINKDDIHIFKFQYKFRYLCDDCLKEVIAFFEAE